MDPDGAGIVQVIEPLDALAYSGPASSTVSSRRFLIVSDT
jgi:hypothetical protein